MRTPQVRSLHQGNGRFKARLEGAVSGNVLLRQALDMARASVAGKIKNTWQVIQRGAR